MNNSSQKLLWGILFVLSPIIGILFTPNSVKKSFKHVCLCFTSNCPDEKKHTKNFIFKILGILLFILALPLFIGFGLNCIGL